MNIFLDIIVFLVILGVIVMIHEFGHLIFAKMVNCLVREYSVGMGPKIVSKKFKEIEYSLRAFPLGGFCAIAGEIDEELLKGVDKVWLKFNKRNEVERIYTNSIKGITEELKAYTLLSYDLVGKTKKDKIKKYERNLDIAGVTYNNLFVEVGSEERVETFKVVSDCQIVYAKNQTFQIAPRGRRLNDKRLRSQAFVMFGGPLFNFLLGFLVFFIAGIIIGSPVLTSNKIGEVADESFAKKVLVMEKGDELTKINGSEIKGFKDIDGALQSFRDGTTKELEIEYKRQNQTIVKKANPYISVYTLGGITVQERDGKISVLNANSRIKQYKQGLKPGVEILKINGNAITSWREFLKFFEGLEGNENKKDNVLKLTILNEQKEEKEIEVNYFSRKLLKSLQGSTNYPMAKITLGVGAISKYKFGNGFITGFDLTIDSMGQVFKTIKLLFVSKEVGVGDLSGPIGIFSITQQIRKQGFVAILRWVGLLSINIGLLNLFPIPALDGGRMLFVLYEGVARRKPNKKVETILITVTMLLLFGLIILISIKDIISIIGG